LTNGTLAASAIYDSYYDPIEKSNYGMDVIGEVNGFSIAEFNVLAGKQYSLITWV